VQGRRGLESVQAPQARRRRDRCPEAGQYSNRFRCHLNEEHIFILKGSATLILGPRKYVLSPGPCRAARRPTLSLGEFQLSQAHFVRGQIWGQLLLATSSGSRRIKRLPSRFESLPFH
jgi:hypothetical protein